MLRASARRNRDDEEERADGALIDFRIGRAQQSLRQAVAVLQKMIARLNSRPGSGVNFLLITEIVRAERAVERARETLRKIVRSD